MLDTLVGRSLQELEEVIDIPWDSDDPKMNSIKLGAITVVLNTQTKVDDTLLRRRQTDVLAQLFAKIDEVEKTRPPTLELEAAQEILS